MKTFFLPVLLACACITPVSANSSEAAASNDANDIAVIKQIQQDMGDAMVAVDIDKLNQIYADDWVIAASPGKIVTKESVLRNFKSGKNKLESFELGPMDVQVFGNVAIVHGGATEKKSWNGQDVSGQYVWMDIMEKRAGKWVVVKSGGARVK